MITYKQDFNYSIIIDNKLIKFRPWTTLDEKKFLLKYDKDNYTISDIYETLIIPCLENKNIELNEIDKKYLLIKIREVSIGSDIELRYICNSCNNVNEISLEIEDILVYKKSNFKTIKVDDIIITFDNPATQNLIKRLENLEQGSFEYNFINFLIHIKTFSYDNKKYKHFSFDELKVFFESIPSRIYNKLFKEFQEMLGEVKFNIETQCLHCHTKNIIDTENLPNFLWV